ncbi:ABC transporter permease (plasmid) [Sinorhizobium meliloti WSM1022]|uniref:ABC transporter permease subunit n=2 Tax=Rhizobium meliloti TaxID=382 RepID=A0A6A7ZX49_RHIML|nr:ABC transporter permease [Sinorhizobium meliloti]ASQ12339.1 ABC transporter permease [Sinorhizobium meliloti]MDE3762218.1 ABC transporter permease [Sinorhizobium meliloti]MDW9357248.1 ABC transporter permease subunit [Sinorhizobium meliloti]MDW9361073.1 ABC transporter permease [Sinorhizobium meliloti]MDW9384833.1 ABC transporter permease subunit [Sinorhizobium meliloti]
MTDLALPSVRSPGALRQLAIYLIRDKLALCAAVFLLVLIVCVLVGPLFVGELAGKLGLRQRNLPPFALEHGFIYILGADTLGRPILARLIVGAQNTLGIAAAAVFCSMALGGILGLAAGYSERWYSHVILRLADVVMSFPSLLLALIVLYTLGPSMTNLVIVLSITRMPIFIRTARAEVLELRERMFVSAARSMGASTGRILFRHIAPLVLPTLVTIAAIDFATVILAESSLSFLGLGIQPPDFTWGAMVANGRGYLKTAWWIAFWPGLAILLTTLSLNILASWARTVADPLQRWRLQSLRKAPR